ncbi:hypothetical protein SDC9_129023 [bioreactor metagenome]|uniref:Uncharacterized protein n=1 Tax=bioreactor metagenome TaxID=1076179 RepID=A0A645CYK7_9ZZZZ
MDGAQVIFDVPVVLPSGNLFVGEVGVTGFERFVFGCIGCQPLFALLRRKPLELTVKSCAVALRIHDHFKIVPPRSMPVDLHLLLLCGPSPPFVIVEESGGGLKGDVVEEVEVLRCRLPVTMRCFLVIEHAERLPGIPFVFQPVEGSFGDDIGAVPFLSDLLSVDQEVGIVVLALSGQHHGEVKSLGDTVEVYLTDHGCLVAVGLHELREVGLVPVERLHVVHLAIDKTVLAR